MKSSRLLFLIVASAVCISACVDGSGDTDDQDASHGPPESGHGGGPGIQPRPDSGSDPNAGLDGGVPPTPPESPDGASTADAGTDADTPPGPGLDGGPDLSAPDAGADADTEPDAGSDGSAAFTAYEGFEERYIMTSDDDPVDVCRVRYELRAVGEPSVACAECSWDVVVERRNPTVMVDVDNACANSELALDQAGIAAGEGERVAYGYVYEYVGHSNVLMHFDEELGAWEAVTFANWSEETGEFFYDRRDGFCSYGGNGPAFDNPGICGLSGEAFVSD